MTVKELINHLQQFESETKVMFSHLDHTDYMYKLDLREEDVVLGDVVSDHYDEDNELWDDEDNYCGPEVVLFNLSLE
jgi:hypothetical protein